MNNRSVDEIKAVLARKGYLFFEKGIYNLNLVGERTTNGKVNLFDDTLHVIYREKEGGELIIKSYEFTTDPGDDYLLKFYDGTTGTAIVVPNQYRALWTRGMHRGKYEALVQRGPIKVYRDSDKDLELDFDPNSIEGTTGINCHKAGLNTTNVDSNSAGCQVFKKSTDFDKFMKLVITSEKHHGKTFTYTLLTSDDFDN